MTYEADALNAFRGILARTELLTFYGLPIQHLNRRPTKSQDCIHTESGFLQSLLWVQDRTAQFSLLSKHGITQVSSLGPQFEKSLGRKKGMPTWSWVSCKSHDVNIIGSHISKYGMNDKVCYSCIVFIEDGAARLQIAPRKLTDDGSPLPESMSLLTFENAYIIREIDPKPLIKHFRKIISARHFDTRYTPLKTLDGVPIVKRPGDGDNPLSFNESVWLHVDREAGTDMAAITAGMATLDAILLEVRSTEHLTLENDLSISMEQGTMSNSVAHLRYSFLLVGQRKLKPATRLGVLHATGWTRSRLMNPDAFGRGRITLG